MVGITVALPGTGQGTRLPCRARRLAFLQGSLGSNGSGFPFDGPNPVQIINSYITKFWQVRPMNRRERRQQEKLRRKTGAPKMEAAPRLELAGQHHRAGRLNDAVVHYMSALEVDLNCVDGYFNLGIALKNLGQLDGAVAHYQKVLKINPGHAKAHNNLGNTLRDQGRLEDTIVCYRKAIKLKSNYVEARYNLGVALMNRGRLDEAAEHFTAALKINPDLYPSP